MRREGRSPACINRSRRRSSDKRVAISGGGILNTVKALSASGVPPEAAPRRNGKGAVKGSKETVKTCSGWPVVARPGLATSPNLWFGAHSTAWAVGSDLGPRPGLGERAQGTGCARGVRAAERAYHACGTSVRRAVGESSAAFGGQGPPTYVSHLRRLLPSGCISTTSGGYRLQGGSVDGPGSKRQWPGRQNVAPQATLRGRPGA